MNAAGLNYVVISPVKDEEQYIETTIRAMVGQTVRPSLWVIVDDGSLDGTSAIVERAAREHSWIRVLRIERDARRRLGSAEIRAFEAGYQVVRDAKHDFIVKLDGDLDFRADYFERLMREFHEDEVLGIASGVYVENHAGEWRPVRMPTYHASGASKMVRAECFREIDGFVLSAGWDTVDEIKAQARGWKTRHCGELQFRHLKREGSASGALSTNRLHGEVYYVSGGGRLFFLLKVLHRLLTGRPILGAGLAMLSGYLKAWATGKPLLVSDVEARFYRRLLNRRMVSGMKGVLRRMGSRGQRPAWSPS